jgi:single-strand DNA-binding protein
LTKGSKVLVEGRLIADQATGCPRIWNRQDGSPAASFELNADTVRFLSPKGDGNSHADSEPAGQTVAEEEIPLEQLTQVATWW